MKKAIKCLLATLAAIFVTASAFAQVTNSSLGGSIVDENGEPVIGAAVIATHEPSGTVYGAATNGQGRFTINGMRPGGPYSVEVSSLGYQTATYTGITLQLAETYALNATLKEESLTLGESVVIATASSKFATEKTGAVTNVNNDQLVALPNVNRSLTEVTKVSPYGGKGMSIAGSDGRTSSFTVDGASFNNNFGLSADLPGGGNPISIDAIEEMQIVVSPFDVRQTNFVGGAVNAITKSGTNTLKGTAYIYHRNENMRGDVVAGETIPTARDRDRNTTYGFTLGGPIVKNKLFFFVNFEKATTPTQITSWRPSTNGVANPDAYISRTTVADMQRVQKYVMDKYGYDVGSYDDYSGQEGDTKALARLDWNITSKHHLAVRYNYTLNRYWAPTNASSMDPRPARPVFGRLSQYAMSFSNATYSSDNVANTFSFDLNSRFNNNLSNQLLVTYSILDTRRGSPSQPFPFVDIMDGTGTTTPYMSLGYELFTWHNGYHNRSITAKDDIIYYFGYHKLTAGVAYDYQMVDNVYMRNGTGYYRYYSLDDFLNQATPELVNLTYGFNGEEAPGARVRYHKPAVYVQDEWNPTAKLKLTAGVRLETIIYDKRDVIRNNALYNLDYNGFHVDTGIWPTPKIQASPRLGFTYDVLGNGDLKLRGGTGLFTGRLPLVFFTNMPSNAGMYQNQATVWAKDGLAGTEEILNAFNGKFITDKDELLKYLNGLNPERFPTTITPDKGTGKSSVAAVDPKFNMPQIWKTSFAVDYNLPFSFPFSISAEGILNKNVNAVYIQDINQKPIAGFARLNGADNRPIFPTDYTYTGTSAYVLQNTHKGYGLIGSFQINATPVDGLNIMAAYTHTIQKELTGMPGSDASSAFTYIPTVYGPNNPALHNSEYVTPDRYYVNLTYNDKANNHYSLFYEAWRGGYNYSYMYTNDLNGDLSPYDAIYIPTENDYQQGQVKFASADDASRFFAYAKKDAYLSKNMGKYAEAYSVYSPWVHRLDFHYAHDFVVRIGNTKNVLQLNLDVNNILNMFNSNWGVSKQMNPDLNFGRILKVEGVGKDGIPVMSTPAAVSGNTEIWKYAHNIGQVWSAQIGVKYLFN
jgi:hypothetical protein